MASDAGNGGVMVTTVHRHPQVDEDEAKAAPDHGDGPTEALATAARQAGADNSDGADQAGSGGSDSKGDTPGHAEDWCVLHWGSVRASLHSRASRAHIVHPRELRMTGSGGGASFQCGVQASWILRYVLHTAIACRALRAALTHHRATTPLRSSLREWAKKRLRLQELPTADTGASGSTSVATKPAPVNPAMRRPSATRGPVLTVQTWTTRYGTRDPASGARRGS